MVNNQFMALTFLTGYFGGHDIGAWAPEGMYPSGIESPAKPLTLLADFNAFRHSVFLSGFLLFILRLL